jgi:hypothetical protein
MVPAGANSRYAMKIAKRASRAGDTVNPQELADYERNEAYWAKPARERVLSALAVANRVIKEQIARHNDASASEPIKSRK